ncbi:MAG: hypothetical protein AW09_000986 [Candidatus Accumulibacter phosphatis]|uniref:Uncharacterized protein n=1 Tax=Candidatus Accumulibacter phosphatis TaxID=327160 RepID=A0A080M090_9PROT|nr:MAG: hypothetical protein AW09_000986 [Candidatus Accumulibacter phosphatis]
MVVATDDMRDAHIPVIDDDTEIVGRRPIGARNDQVVKFAIGDLDPTLDKVIPGDHPVGRISEADHRLHPHRRRRQGLARIRTPATIVTWLEACSTLLLAQLIEFCRRHVTGVGATGQEHFFDDLLVARHPLRLVEGPLVVLEPQPVHAVKNRLHRFRSRTYQVGVLDAQDEAAGMVASVSPREKGSARPTDMQETGWRRRKTGTDHGHSSQSGKVPILVEALRQFPGNLQAYLHLRLQLA